MSTISRRNAVHVPPERGLVALQLQRSSDASDFWPASVSPTTLRRMNLAIELRTLVSAFTNQMTELAKREALRQVSNTLGVETPSPRSSPRPKRGRRTSEDLADVKRRILEHLA